MASSNNSIVKSDATPVQVPGQMQLSEEFVNAAKELIQAGDDDRDFAAQLDRIVNADELSDILPMEGETGTISLKDYVGKCLRIDTVKLQPSKLTEGMPFFAVLFGADSNGKDAVFTSGSAKIVAQIIGMQRKKVFPILARVVEYETNNKTKMRELVGVTKETYAKEGSF